MSISSLAILVSRLVADAAAPEATVGVHDGPGTPQVALDVAVGVVPFHAVRPAARPGVLVVVLAVACPPTAGAPTPVVGVVLDGRARPLLVAGRDSPRLVVPTDGPDAALDVPVAVDARALVAAGPHRAVNALRDVPPAKEADETNVDRHPDAVLQTPPAGLAGRPVAETGPALGPNDANAVLRAQAVVAVVAVRPDVAAAGADTETVVEVGTLVGRAPETGAVDDPLAGDPPLRPVLVVRPHVETSPPGLPIHGRGGAPLAQRPVLVGASFRVGEEILEAGLDGAGVRDRPPAPVRQVVGPVEVASPLARVGQGVPGRRAGAVGTGGVVPVLVVADVEVAVLPAVPFLDDVDVADAGSPHDVPPAESPVVDVVATRTVHAARLRRLAVHLVVPARVTPSQTRPGHRPTRPVHAGRGEALGAGPRPPDYADRLWAGGKRPDRLERLRRDRRDGWGTIDNLLRADAALPL